MLSRKKTIKTPNSFEIVLILVLFFFLFTRNAKDLGKAGKTVRKNMDVSIAGLKIWQFSEEMHLTFPFLGHTQELC